MSAPDGPVPIDIDIDVLTLDGVVVRDRDVFGAALVDELTRLVRTEGLPARVDQAGRRPVTVVTPGPGRPDHDTVLAHEVARGVYRTFGGRR